MSTRGRALERIENACVGLRADLRQLHEAANSAHRAVLLGGAPQAFDNLLEIAGRLEGMPRRLAVVLREISKLEADS